MGTAVWTPPPEQLLSTLQAIGVRNLQAAERKEGFIALPMRPGGGGRGGGDGGPHLDLHTFSEVHLHIKSSGNQAHINNQLHLLTYLEQVLGLCPFSEILK